MPATDPGVPELKLVREAAEPTPASSRSQPQPTTGSPTVVASGAEATADQAKTPVSSKQACHAIGPFADEGKGREVADRLRQSGVVGDLRKYEEPDNRYWVYLPPYGTQGAAFQAEKALKQQGIVDIQVLAGGAKKNAVSLGVFRDRAIAERRVQQIQGMDYAPNLEVLERTRATYWLEYPAGADKVLSDDQWQALSNDYPGLRLENRPCR
jgi:hypothetical protein